jgi:hypothetical protein
VLEVSGDNQVTLNEDISADAGSLRAPASFAFDSVFGPESSHDDVFAALGPSVLENARMGVNCSVFAYGQTGSGKSHTMMGGQDDQDWARDRDWVRDRGQQCQGRGRGQRAAPPPLARLLETRDWPSLGLIPRICGGLLAVHGGDRGEGDRGAAATNKATNKATSAVTLSFVEIYNEKVRDLLCDNSHAGSSSPRSTDSAATASSATSTAAAAAEPARMVFTARRPADVYKDALRLREHPERGVYVDGLSAHDVSSYDDVEALLVQGNHARVVAETDKNEASSRSHAVVFITVNQQTHTIQGSHVTKRSRISLVDLAGSERTTKSTVPRDWLGGEDPAMDPTATTKTRNDGSPVQRRRRETANINRSLNTLGDVVKALAEGSSGGGGRGGGGGTGGRGAAAFVPYRSSVLTWLLKDDLGGNGRTTMIGTVSPARTHFHESQSTLKYISRCKHIVNRITINVAERGGPDTSTLVRQLRRQNQVLLLQLRQCVCNPAIMSRYGGGGQSGNHIAGAALEDAVMVNSAAGDLISSGVSPRARSSPPAARQSMGSPRRGSSSTITSISSYTAASDADSSSNIEQSEGGQQARHGRRRPRRGRKRSVGEKMFMAYLDRERDMRDGREGAMMNSLTEAMNTAEASLETDVYRHERRGAGGGASGESVDASGDVGEPGASTIDAAREVIEAGEAGDAVPRTTFNLQDLSGFLGVGNDSEREGTAGRSPLTVERPHVDREEGPGDGARLAGDQRSRMEVAFPTFSGGNALPRLECDHDGSVSGVSTSGVLVTPTRFGDVWQSQEGEGTAGVGQAEYVEMLEDVVEDQANEMNMLRATVQRLRHADRMARLLGIVGVGVGGGGQSIVEQKTTGTTSAASGEDGTETKESEHGGNMDHTDSDLDHHAHISCSSGASTWRPHRASRDSSKSVDIAVRGRSSEEKVATDTAEDVVAAAEGGKIAAGDDTAAAEEHTYRTAALLAVDTGSNGVKHGDDLGNIFGMAADGSDRGGAASPFERPRLWSDASAGSSDTGGRRSSPSVESAGAGNKRVSRKYSAEAKLFASADPPSLLETYFDQTLGGGGGGARVGGESKEHDEVQQASVRSRTNARMSDAEDAFLEGAY